MRTDSPARARLLETATRLFYAEGVHAVGVDRIIAEANVAKWTFYHHFPTKDDLVRAYVDAQSQQVRRATAAEVGGATGHAAILTMFERIGEDARGPRRRGCPFVNTAAEYPVATHPVREAIADHRRWFRELVRELLAADGDPDAARKADMFVVLKDGIYVGFELDDESALRNLTHDLVTRILESPAPVGRQRPPS